MNILCGVQATGNGHINRSREVVKELKNRGHDVNTIFSGREKGFFDIQDFRPYRILKGLTFATNNGKIQYWKTLTSLDIGQFNDDIKSLCNSVGGYHLVISDFEPITARYAKRKDILSIGLSHQASFYGKVPVNYYDPIALYITRNFAKCDINIGIHWDTFGNDHIIPPIIPELQNRKVKDKYLVYLPFENNKFLEVLEKFSDKQFYIYTGNKFKSTDTIIHMPFSRTTFLNDLEECEGVICNAGFELISEASSIGKKVLVKAVKKQYEQNSNAKCIAELGLGLSTKKINEKSIKKLLDFKVPTVRYPNTAKLFVDWLEGKTFDVKQLSAKCWKE